MGDLVVYSRSLTGQLRHLAEVFKTLEKAGFILNPDKLRLTRAKISFLGHLVSAQGVKILFCLNEWRPFGTFQLPRTLREFGDFWKWRSSMGVSLNISRRLNSSTR
jgi:hypothetical protein